MAKFCEFCGADWTTYSEDPDMSPLGFRLRGMNLCCEEQVVFWVENKSRLSPRNQGRVLRELGYEPRVLTPDQEDFIDREMKEHLYNAFDAIHGEVEYANEGVRPSDIARYLNKYWDMGDFYREWWETDDEGEWS